MELRPWRWQLLRVRRAKIPAVERDVCERFGETVIQLVLTGGLSPQATDLRLFHGNPDHADNAARWLTERLDLHQRRETLRDLVEVAILIFVFLEVFPLLAQWLGWLAAHTLGWLR